LLRLVDTHAHLAHKQFSLEIDRYLGLAQQAGLIGIICIGTNATDSALCVELAERYPLLRASVGIHPNNCAQAEAGDWESVVALAGKSGVVAIGETGLDRYWDDSPWDLQVEYLHRHIQLSRQTNLPLVIHTRDCIDEAIDLLEAQMAQGLFAGVMHSFTGNLKQVQRCLELSLYISLAGMVTFKNAADLQAVAKEIPLDRLMVETDSPYLTPHPHRGHKPNHPAMVAHTLNCLAGLRGMPPDTLANITTANANRLFRLGLAEF
jgi:TatD DNase family protein